MVTIATDESGREDFAQKYVVEGGRVYLRAALKAQEEKDRLDAKAFEKRIEKRLREAALSSK